MTWSAQSSEHNQIENLWKIIGNNVKARKLMTMTSLWHQLQEKWDKLMPEQCEKLMKFYGHMQE